MPVSSSASMTIRPEMMCSPPANLRVAETSAFREDVLSTFRRASSSFTCAVNAMGCILPLRDTCPGPVRSPTRVGSRACRRRRESRRTRPSRPPASRSGSCRGGAVAAADLAQQERARPGPRAARPAPRRPRRPSGRRRPRPPAAPGACVVQHLEVLRPRVMPAVSPDSPDARLSVDDRPRARAVQGVRAARGRAGAAAPTCTRSPGPSTTQSAASIASTASGHAGGSGGSSRTCSIRPGGHGDARSARRRASGRPSGVDDVRLDEQRDRGHRQHPAAGAQQPAHPVEALDRVARAAPTARRSAGCPRRAGPGRPRS